ncbi:replication protein A, subunit RPA32 [Dentipellis sp. KUC8613]|nr:replication protein A, subunit RPA32 [Dentipellis sp. KUC8613]
MSQNDYYGNGGGGGGGGGYLTGGSPFGSAAGSPGGAGRRSALGQSLRPFTAKQLINATQAHADADWMIENTEIGQVTVVAQVISIQTQTTNSVYWLDDGTGRIEARFWSDSTSQGDNDVFAGIVENSYVRATGNLKTFGNKRYINALNIRPVKDWHEIFFHLVEAMGITLIFERGPPSGPGQHHGNQDMQSATSAYTAQSHSSAALNQYAHLPPLQRRIVEFILQQPPNPEGFHIVAISRAVGGDAEGISDALEKLMDEGHVFSTIDEEHYNVSA